MKTIAGFVLLLALAGCAARSQPAPSAAALCTDPDLIQAVEADLKPTMPGARVLGLALQGNVGNLYPIDIDVETRGGHKCIVRLARRYTRADGSQYWRVEEGSVGAFEYAETLRKSWGAVK